MQLPVGEFSAFMHGFVDGGQVRSQTPVPSHAPPGQVVPRSYGLAPAHAPPWQAPTVLQELPTSHAVPSGAGGLEQTPVDGSHVPAAWHASWAAHVTVLPAVQMPARQVSPEWQAFPSLHVVPSVTVGFEHCPLAGSQVPGVWQVSEAAQATGFDPTHAPPRHWSV